MYWRDAFFNQLTPKEKKFPTSMTLLVPVPELLLTDFDPKTGVPELEWRQSLQQHDAIPTWRWMNSYNVGCLQSPAASMLICNSH